MTKELIPFQVETSRVLDLLAKQIYQSPLALLRENAQNAYDAVLMRARSVPGCAACIDIVVEPDQIRVVDHGIGMTPGEVRDNYWRAGHSGKNTEEARAAGVVGTFGIGAMANFGIAGELVVETESAATGERCRSRAVLDKLSLNEDCVELETLDTQHEPGTSVTAIILPKYRVDVEEATRYIVEFVQLLEVPVTVNGIEVSGGLVQSLVPVPPAAWTLEERQCQLGKRLTADTTLVISSNAELWIDLSDIVWSGQAVGGRVTLRSGTAALRTFRTGFGLATVGVGSTYQFGGVADVRNLQPTAGREALTTDSMQFLQSLIREIDNFASRQLADRPECDSSTPFMSWIAASGRYDLGAYLRATIQPGDKRVALREIKKLSEEDPVLIYSGGDQTIVRRHASEDRPVVVLARSNPRHGCEREYLNQFCRTEELSDAPVASDIKARKDYSGAELAFVYRVESILDGDYFLKANVELGRISHGLPILTKETGGRVRVTIDPSGQTMSLVLGVYDNEFSAFGSMLKDFVRNIVFPSIAPYVPSSSRQGAEAFLRTIKKPREVFEYEDTDLGELPQVWSDYRDGRISMKQAVQRSMEAVRTGVQVVDSGATASIQEVVPDVVQNEKILRKGTAAEESVTLEAVPAISRTEISCEAKILTIGAADAPLQGYRCFLAITEQAREERAEFFFQPHKTSVVWGGQRVLFVFLHHSERFGLYYDLQTHGTLAPEGGGGPYPTCSIVLKDNIYVPVPPAIESRFVPMAGERKRFYVRHDILRVSEDDEWRQGGGERVRE